MTGAQQSSELLFQALWNMRPKVYISLILSYSQLWQQRFQLNSKMILENHWQFQGLSHSSDKCHPTVLASLSQSHLEKDAAKLRRTLDNIFKIAKTALEALSLDYIQICLACPVILHLLEAAKMEDRLSMTHGAIFLPGTFARKTLIPILW